MSTVPPPLAPEDGSAPATATAASDAAVEATVEDVVHHGRRRLFLGTLLVLALLGAGGWFLLHRGAAHPVSLSTAQKRLAATSSSGQAAPLVPTQGVYAATGSGTDRLSLPPLSQAQGPLIPATVQHRPDGCWDLRVDYSSNHWQTWGFCARNGALVTTGGETWQRWMVGPTAITNDTKASCVPPGPQIPTPRVKGQTWTQSCTITNNMIKGATTTGGPYTFDGETSVAIGGKARPALQFTQHRTLRGGQEGTETTTWWFDASSGLPLRNHRSVKLDTKTPFGTSTYSEDGTFTLTSVTPTS